jgi:hypothetical protein
MTCDASRTRSIAPAALLYLGLAGAGHFLWEIAQLPLYTIWWTGTKREILYAVIHCTGGDFLITASALALAALGARIGRWPLFGGRMALTAILLGLAYTVLSEWFNTKLRQNWSYIEAMPVLPPLGTGLTPFLQWWPVNVEEGCPDGTDPVYALPALSRPERQALF